MIKTYYYLTKPGIIQGNLLTAVAGFLVASKRHIDWPLLLATLSGTALIIASACVINNYIDRDIDRRMNRTKKRALVTGQVTASRALSFAAVLAIAGFMILAIGTNWLTVLVGAIGFLDYVILYGWTKRRGPYGTLVGSISGAVPPVAGYTAVTGRFDLTAIWLFITLVCWQMPHFYAIAIYRQKDYEAAGVPVLPVVRGRPATGLRIVGYTSILLITVIGLTIWGAAGYIYLIGGLLLVSSWLRQEITGFQQAEIKWARQTFFYSLIVISGLSVLLVIDALL